MGPSGYAPARIALKAGVPARLVFTRTAESACMAQVQAPEMGVAKTELPLNEPASVTFTPEEAGEYTFACGVNLVKGALLVRS